MTSPDPSHLAFNSLMRRLSARVRESGFKRFGQRFGRETPEVWQTIGVQKSRWNDAEEKRLTINFGVAPKAVLRFRKELATTPPPDYTCSIRGRMSSLEPATSDKWWNVTDEKTAATVAHEIVSVFNSKLIPFMDQTQSEKEILDLWSAGKVYGVEIESDEARIILLAEKNDPATSIAVLNYADKFLSSLAKVRAERFLSAFHQHFPAIHPRL